MVFLIVVASIIIFFSAILSIRAHIHAEYEHGKEFILFAKYLFFKIPILPAKEKPPKEKKEKPPKEEKEEEKPKEDKPKSKGPNPLKALYANEGVDGILEIIKKLMLVINKFGSRMIDSFVVDEFFLDITVSDTDAATTAEEYGKMCQKVFPVVGAMCANCNVKKYSLNVDPDYLGSSNEYAFSAEISVNPRKLINAVLLFAFGAIFKVGIRVIVGIFKKDKTAPESKTEKPQEDGDIVNI